MGIERFNAECRESVFAFLEEWNRLTERIGFWLDLEHAYRTLDESYIESVWWALCADQRARAALRGQQGRALLPALRDDAVLARGRARLPRRGRPERVPEAAGAAAASERLLVWTTTPWTLPGNVAVAVSPTASYARVRVADEIFVLAAARVEAVLGEGSARCSSALSGAELVERYGSYRGTDLRGRTIARPGPLPILADEFVTTEDGTGIVHLAPAFGEDDYRVAAAAPEVPFDPTRRETLLQPGAARRHLRRARTRNREGASYEGRFVKDAALTEELIEDLRARGLLLKVQDYEHSYPHCWRCGTPLIYYAKPSWYIATSRCATSCWRRTRRSTGIRRTSSTGASGTG